MESLNDVNAGREIAKARGTLVKILQNVHCLARRIPVSWKCARAHVCSRAQGADSKRSGIEYADSSILRR
jgi:hypothetical protein